MKQYLLFIKRQFALLSFGFSCVFWANLGQSFFLGSYSQAIKEDLALSAAQYGQIYSFATLCSAFTIIWLGPLIDRWPLRRVLIFSAFGLLLACTLMSFVYQVFFLCLALYLLRLFGQGMTYQIGSITMARYYVENRGKALSLAACGMPIGEMLLPVLAIFLMSVVGWRSSWQIFAVSIPLVFLPLCLALLKRSQWEDKHLLDADEKKKKAKPAWRLLFSDHRFWILLPLYLSMPFIITAFFVHQDIILAHKQWSTVLLASGFVLFGAVHWASSMLVGVLVDRYSGVALTRIYSLPLVAALALAANVDGAWVLMAMMFLFGVTVGAASPIFGALWAEVYGTNQIASIKSLAGFLVVGSTAISPILFGVLFDRGASVGDIFNVIALVLVCVTLMMRFSYRHVNGT